jgi:hypothetical protein
MAQMAQMAHEAANRQIGKSANQRVGEAAFVLEEEHPPALLGVRGIVPDNHRGRRVATMDDTEWLFYEKLG